MKNFTSHLKHFIVLWIAACWILSCQTAQSQTISFPGALGFGAKATGGRAGTVYHVTTLADSGPGSFRDAVSQQNRIIVFDVGGYINLKTAVSVKSNNTIAGQTAPGEGIGFRGGEISFASSTNIICRYIRIRPGSETSSTGDDGLSFYRATNVIVDHSSIEFAPWNNIDGVSDDWQNHPVNSITVQHSLIADPTGQQFGAHTEAVNGTWSWFYNIFANSHNRNPLAKVNTVFVNNVLYNCSAGYTTHTSTKFKHDIISNYFIFGPASGSTDNTWYQVDKNQTIYYDGNMKDSNADGVLNGSTTTPYWYQGPGTILTAPWSPFAGVTIYSAATAYRLTTSDAGALPRDQMDSLVINQVKTLGNGTTGTGVGTTGPGGGLYTTQVQTGLGNNGYGVINAGVKDTDTDNDGMPDYWEKATASDTSVNDAMTLAADGYTLLEHYINWLADPHAISSTNSYVDVDLYQYTSGFGTYTPVYTVNNPNNGTVTLLADGHTARFTPTADFTGLGSFAFNVTTADGGTYANTVNVLAVKRQNPQTIIFGAIPSKKVGDADFDASATASSGLAITYSSSNTAVATIVNGKVHIIAAGSAIITASQAGSSAWLAAADVAQTLLVTVQAQIITFNPIAAKAYGDADFNVGATASSGLAVNYTSSNPAVATVSSTGLVHIVGAGSATITASQPGNASNGAATSVPQTLTVSPANLSITANNQSRLYGLANPALTASYSGFVNQETQASLTTLPTLSTTATSTSAAGVYPITASGATSANYNITYVAGTLTITPLANAGLSNIAINAGSLSPVFATGTFAYNVSVNNSVASITLTATASNATATLKINGTPVVSGNASAPIALSAGNNTITIVVTAQDGVTTNTYTVSIYRGVDQDAMIATNVLTPNGDGKNDNWIIKDIELYPDNTVTVFDRAGRIVYSAKKYANNWDGTFGGAALHQDTYYYLIDLGPGLRKIKGFITVVRNR